MLFAQRLGLSILLVTGSNLAAGRQPSLGRAQSLIAQGNEPAALAEMEALLRRDPDDLFALANVGIISARMGRVRRAQQCLSLAYRLKPDDLQLGLALLEVEATSGHKDISAKIATQLAASVRLTNELVWKAIQMLQRLGDAPSAAIFAKLAIAVSPAQHQLLAALFETNGDIRAASDEMQEAIRIDPQDDTRYFRLGMFYLKHRTPALAVLVFQHGIEKREDSALLWLGLGVSQCLDEKVDAAELSLRKAIDRKPHFTDAYVLLGDILEQEKPREALGIFRATIAEHPDLPIAYYYYGRLAMILNEGSISETVAMLQKAVALDPAFTDSHYELGRALEQTKQNEDAAKQFEICLKQNPMLYKAHYRLAILYKKRGDTVRSANAMRAFQQAQKLQDPATESKRLDYTVEKR